MHNVRRTGALRPTSGPSNKRGGVASLAGRHKRRPPRGMHINHDDIAAMAAGAQGIQMLRAMDREVVALKRQVSKNSSIFPQTRSPQTQSSVN